MQSKGLVMTMAFNCEESRILIELAALDQTPIDDAMLEKYMLLSAQASAFLRTRSMAAPPEFPRVAPPQRPDSNRLSQTTTTDWDSAKPATGRRNES
jgi:hypothetical protein